MNWTSLTTQEQLEAIKNDTSGQVHLIFKHSTRCSISSMALNRLERSWKDGETSIQPHLLDLISYREVSNAIQGTFGVVHESPQAILVKNGKAVYNASHMAISYQEIKNNDN
ncbi:MAG: bacillithiol system redox-active protein YtxJ [Cytophagales bacterium]|nr:bacillithiol system redox-active protein YtxJ [Cytophagales bacterium]